jgi:hypothetical protein
MATRPAAEPSIRLLTNFMLNLQVALFREGSGSVGWKTPSRLVP